MKRALNGHHRIIDRQAGKDLARAPDIAGPSGVHSFAQQQLRSVAYNLPGIARRVCRGAEPVQAGQEVDKAEPEIQAFWRFPQQPPNAAIEILIAKAFPAHPRECELPLGPVGQPIELPRKILDSRSVAAFNSRLGQFEQKAWFVR